RSLLPWTKAARCEPSSSPRILPLGKPRKRSKYFPEPSCASGSLHFDGDAPGLLVEDGNARLGRAQSLVPHLELVLAGWKVVESELTIGAGDRIVRVRRHDDPTNHPRVKIAIDPHDFRLLKRNRNRSALRL